MAMIRKQLYIAPQHQQKLLRLADRWGCTEAEIVRRALDQLPDPETSIEARLAEAGVLVPPPLDDDLLTEEEVVLAEQELDAWLESRGGSLGLAEAVIEDRR